MLAAASRRRGLHHTGAAALSIAGRNLGRPAARLASVARSGAGGTSWAMAPIHARSARAMATTPWGAFVPRAMRCRERCHKRTWAFHLRAWRGWGPCSRRRGRGRRTGAGARDAQAPALRARRAGGLPVWGMPPGRRRAPVASSEGGTPREGRRGLGCSTRVRSPSAAPGGPATVHERPAGPGGPRPLGRAATSAPGLAVLARAVGGVQGGRSRRAHLLGRRAAAPGWDSPPPGAPGEGPGPREPGPSSGEPATGATL